GLVRFAELQEENDRLTSEIAELQSKIERMTANDARTQQELAESKQEAARYIRSYTELLTSLNNAVMVLNTAQENARITAELPRPELVPSQEPESGAAARPSSRQRNPIA